MSTAKISGKNIQREWHLIDAKDKTLGRLAVEVAKLLRGKNKVNFVPYLDQGDYVVVVNSAKVSVTGKKENQKMYYRHSGYPGGLKSESLGKLRSRRPEEILRHAILGMLPKGSLGRGMITKLYIFAGETHNMDRQLGIKKEKVAKKVEEQAVASV